LKILSEAKRWHADGTFSCVPKGFYQLYIIHGLHKSNMIPSAFIFLTGKCEELYKIMIAKLKEGAFNNAIELNPQELTINFIDFKVNMYKEI
jgi:hypothetical protein